MHFVTLPAVLLLGACLGQKHLHPEGHMPHRFADAKKWAKRFESPERTAWQKPNHVIDKMNIQPGMVVADIGAGTGYLLPYLAAATTSRGQVVGIDVEPNLVDYMQARIQREKIPSTSARLGQPTDPQLEAGRYNRIVMVNTWHHISSRPQFATKLAAALAPEGQLYIVDFDPTAGGPGPPPGHRLSPGTVKQELQGANLRAEVISEDLAYQYIIRAWR